MGEVLKSLLGAPIPNVLILFGLLLIGLAVVGRIRGKVELEKASRIIAGALGIIFVSVGLFMHLRNGGTAGQPGRVLRYSLTVQKYRDGQPYQEPFKPEGDINFEPDYRVRFVVSSPQPGSLYILDEGPTKKGGLPQYNMLFPSPTANNGSAMIAPEQQVPIPEQSWFRFDEERGTEIVWFVWAGRGIPELEAVRAVVNPQERGAVSSPSQIYSVKTFLSNLKDVKVEVERDPAREATALKTEGDILVYPLKLEHH